MATYLWGLLGVKPFHHTREPKVGSRVGVRPEFDCGLIPIETMEVDTLQGIGDFVQRQAQYLPVGGSSEIGPNGRVSDDRELYSSIRGRQVVHEGP
jgi:hypothetical protein